MGKQTNIEWADGTFNYIWGCTKVSPGCANCYAEKHALRFHKKIWGRDGRRRTMSEAYWRAPLAWNRKEWVTCVACGWRGEKPDFPTCPNCTAMRLMKPTRMRVFAGSMCDVLEADFKLKTVAEVVEPARRRLFALAKNTPSLDWLFLTKRPENQALFPKHWTSGNWPANVWVGVSVENQEYADKRITLLEKIPAPVRFLSCEPLLGHVDLTNYLKHPPADPTTGNHRPVDWVIVGGESGPNARPMRPSWARDIAAQCLEAGIPLLFKQWGEWLPAHQLSPEPLDLTGKRFESFDDWDYIKVGKKVAGRLLDGREYLQWPESVPA